MASVEQLLYDTLDELGEDNLKRFKSFLRRDGPIPASALEKADATDTVDQMVDRFGPERAVKITLDILRKMNQNHLAEELEEKHVEVKITSCSQTGATLDRDTEDLTLKKFLDAHKTNMKKKAECVFEGKEENNAHLHAVYTELFITEGDIKDVNHEHEILKIDEAFKTQMSQDRPIKCNEIFSVLRRNNENKIVLTKGIAGIGKTISVHKFIVDWAEGKANRDIDCMFLLPFRQINVIKDREADLHDFLLEFYPELNDLEKSLLYSKCKLAFIFDGLDESHLPLNFKHEALKSIEERSSVDGLFTSLVKGKLLPSALVWVTSRPAAANQIPLQYVGLFTEVRGFTDQQKEEYFRKRFRNESQASRIISHVKTSRSLYIMCHIPVFCWITATVLQNILTKSNEENINTTPTEMYIHFLLIQMNMKSQKYDGKEERERSKLLHSNRKLIRKLAKLAFEQLKKENIVFYEEDLIECGIDVSKDSEFTGMIAEIFKKEAGLHETKVYCFVHLSVQEFLAAVHVFFCYLDRNMQELQFFFEDSETKMKYELQFFCRKVFKKVPLQDLLRGAVDKAIQSRRGHLDLFLRFLLGISLESSQMSLRGLFPHTEDTTKSIAGISDYIKQLQDEYISEEASINLFYCLLELKDHSLYEEIQRFLSSDEHPGRELSISMCSVLSYVLLMSEKVLDEFNMKMFKTSPVGYMRLIPVVRCCRKALFDGCGLDETCCDALSSALQLSNFYLRELDLSFNDLQDLGVNCLSDGLKSSNCQLNVLRLAGCTLTDQCCENLSSALQSSKYLTELDLSYNDLQDSGVALLSDGLKSCRLNIIRLAGCRLTSPSCESLSSALQSSSSCLRELELSKNNLQDSGVEALSAGLRSSHCHLSVLRLMICNLSDRGCESLSSVLQLPNNCMRELDLSFNDLRDSGVKLLSDGLKSSHCQLNALRLSGCMVTEEGCVHLSSALRSNPSHLRELDLSYNHPGESGVKLLLDSKNRPNCALETLSVNDGGALRIAAGLHKHACVLTLDPDTAHRELRLSEGHVKVTRVEERQPYPDHPQRFDDCPQVLCRESLCGHCYWEVEWTGHTFLSASYEGIGRKGESDDCVFGKNSSSWSLYCSDNRFTAHHDNRFTDIRVPPDSCKRVGVHLDWSAGTLSFYSVSGTHTLTHLHTFNTSFIAPLHAGFRFVYYGSSVSLCQTGQKL